MWFPFLLNEVNGMPPENSGVPLELPLEFLMPTSKRIILPGRCSDAERDPRGIRDGIPGAARPRLNVSVHRSCQKTNGLKRHGKPNMTAAHT